MAGSNFETISEMSITQEQSANQDHCCYEYLQVIGRALTQAIKRAERRGDEKEVSRLFTEKAELIRTLRECRNAS